MDNSNTSAYPTGEAAIRMLTELLNYSFPHVEEQKDTGLDKSLAMQQAKTPGKLE